MAAISDLLVDLKTELTALEGRSISKWLPAKPEHDPEDYQHDVKAYCVLAHALFEEFVEEVSLVTMRDVQSAWQSKTFSRPMVSLLLFYGGALNVNDDEDRNQDSVFDQVRAAIEECVNKHSNALAKNHGFSLKYLRSVLTPVGLDVPDEVRLIASLKELAQARGSYAHSKAKLAAYGEWRRAKRQMSPEQARSIVVDCLELCEAIAKTPQAPVAAVSTLESAW